MNESPEQMKWNYKNIDKIKWRGEAIKEVA